MLCAIAKNLEDDQLSQIQSLERETGLMLVAFSCRTLDPDKEERLRQIEARIGSCLEADPVAVDDDQLAQIRHLEEATGLALVAVRS
jgi:microsomal dipeptidase-like Zn-dependent dipeptidase